MKTTTIAILTVIALIMGAATERACARMSDGPQLQVFVNTLAPHGTWLETSVFGLAWRPHVAAANRNWRPYCHDGRWAWTVHGWYWISDYAWGGIPFHYGRWTVSTRYGWIWVPDANWAPAWVRWRSSPTHFGWAPLPPMPHGRKTACSFDVQVAIGIGSYLFVPRQFFLELNLAPYALHPKPVSRVFRRSTVSHHAYVARRAHHAGSGLPRAVVARTTRRAVRLLRQPRTRRYSLPPHAPSGTQRRDARTRYAPPRTGHAPRRAPTVTYRRPPVRSATPTNAQSGRPRRSRAIVRLLKGDRQEEEQKETAPTQRSRAGGRAARIRALLYKHRAR